MRKVVKLLVKVLAGDDGRIKATEFTTVIWIESTVVNTLVCDSLLSKKDTIPETPNVPPL